VIIISTCFARTVLWSVTNNTSIVLKTVTTAFHTAAAFQTQQFPFKQLFRVRKNSRQAAAGIAGCPSTWNNSASAGRIFVKFHIREFYENLSARFRCAHQSVFRISRSLRDRYAKSIWRCTLLLRRVGGELWCDVTVQCSSVRAVTSPSYAVT
jgi:hypothetical protein